MVDIWKASSHDDEVGTLGPLSVGVVIFYPRCPASHLFPRVLICMETFSESLQNMIQLGTVEMFMYPANQYNPYGIVRRAADMPLLQPFLIFKSNLHTQCIF